MGRWNTQGTVKVGFTRCRGLVALLAALAALCSPPQAAHAQEVANPDTLLIHSANAYRNLLEDDDVLLLVHYQIGYEALPIVRADQAWIVKLVDANGDDLGANTPYPYDSYGYGQGVVSLYWQAVDAPAWEGAHTVTVQGNPAHHPDPQEVSIVLQTGNYCACATAEDAQIALAAQVRLLATHLGGEWAAILVQTTPDGPVLTLSGEGYFANAIPGLKAMVPAILPTQVQELEWTRAEHGQDLQETVADRFAGVWWIEDSLDDLEPVTGLSVGWLTGLAVFVLAGAAVWAAHTQAADPRPGYYGAATVLVLGVWLGWLPVVIMMLLGFAAILGVGYALLLARA